MSQSTFTQYNYTIMNTCIEAKEYNVIMLDLRLKPILK